MRKRFGKISALVLIFALVFCMPMSPIAWGETGEALDVPQATESPEKNEGEMQKNEESDQTDESSSSFEKSDFPEKAGSEDEQKAQKKNKGKTIKGNTGKNATMDVEVSTYAILRDYGGHYNSMYATIHLLANGNEVASKKTILVKSDGKLTRFLGMDFDGWGPSSSITFTDMPKYDDKGQQINYTITADVPEGCIFYTFQGNHDDTTYHYVVRVSPETVVPSFRLKYPDDVPREDFPVTLLQNGKPISTAMVSHWGEGDINKGYQEAEAFFPEVPIFDENGASYIYTIDEEGLSSYVDSFKNQSDPQDGYNFKYTANGANAGDPETITIKIIHTPKNGDDGPKSFTYRILDDDNNEVYKETIKNYDYSENARIKGLRSVVLPMEKDGVRINYHIDVDLGEEPYTYEMRYFGNIWTILFKGDDTPRQVEITVDAEDPNMAGLPDEITGTMRYQDYMNSPPPGIPFTLTREGDKWKGTVEAPLVSTYGSEFLYIFDTLQEIPGLAPLDSSYERRGSKGYLSTTLVQERTIPLTFQIDDSLDESDREYLNTCPMTMIIEPEPDTKNKIVAPAGSFDTPYVIKGLPKYDGNGNTIEYYSVYLKSGTSTVNHSVLNNYEYDVEGNMDDGFVFTFYKRDKSLDSALSHYHMYLYAEWHDMEEDHPPLTFELLKDGQPTGDTLVLNPGENGQPRFQIEKGENVNRYTARLVDPPENYDVEYKWSWTTPSGSGDYKYTNLWVYLTHKDYETKEIPVDVVWDVPEGKEAEFTGNRAYITICGERFWVGGFDSGLYTEKTVSLFERKDLDLSTAPVSAVCEEEYLINNPRAVVNVEYDADFNGRGKGGYHVIVSRVPDTKLVYTFYKYWEVYEGWADWYIKQPKLDYSDLIGNNNWEADPITIIIYRDGKEYDRVEISKETDWRITFTLDRYRDDGSEYEYTFEEDKVDGMKGRIDIRQLGENNGTFQASVFNAGDVIDIPVEKIWKDENDKNSKRPDSILVTLLLDGVPTAMTALLNEANGWKFTFKNLPVYNTAMGDRFRAIRKAVYSFIESIVEGYDHKIEGNQETGFKFTNTYTGNTSISGKKTWKDDNNAAGKRPDSITVNLLANGEKYGSKVVTSANNWEYTFKDLPQTMYGEPVEYTISEEPVPEYDAEIRGYNITNTYQKSKITVKKTSSVKNARIGDTVPFTITIYNKGEARDAMVKAVDIMPEELDYISSDTETISASDDEVVWKVNVPKGGKKEIKLLARINKKAVGKIVNTVVIYDEDEMEVPEDEGGSDDETITLEKKSANEAPPAKKVSAKKLPLSPATGDEAPIGLIIAALLVSGALMSLVRKKEDK